MGGGDKQSARVEFESRNASDSGTGGRGLVVRVLSLHSSNNCRKLSSAPPKSTRGKKKTKKRKKKLVQQQGVSVQAAARLARCLLPRAGSDASLDLPHVTKGIERNKGGGANTWLGVRQMSAPVYDITKGPIYRAYVLSTHTVL